MYLQQRIICQRITKKLYHEDFPSRRSISYVSGNDRYMYKVMAIIVMAISVMAIIVMAIILGV